MELMSFQPRKIPKLTIEQVWRALKAAVDTPARWDIGIAEAFRDDQLLGRAAMARVGGIAVPAFNSDELARYRFARNRRKPHVALIAAIGLLPMQQGARPNLAWLLRLADRIARRLDRRRPVIIDGSNVIPFPKRPSAPSRPDVAVPLLEPQQSA